MKVKYELYNKWIQEDYVVALRTQKEWDLFMKWLEKNTDVQWSNGYTPTNFNDWEEHGTITCILYDWKRSGIMYSGEDYYSSKNYKTIEFKDLFTNEARCDIEVGYLVEIESGDLLVAVPNSNGVLILTDESGSEARLVRIPMGRRGFDITKIYGLPDSYIKGPFSPETRPLLWERGSQRFTLQCPLTNRYLTKLGNGSFDYQSMVCPSPDNMFTNLEIGALPCQDIVRKLRKVLVKNTESE